MRIYLEPKKKVKRGKYEISFNDSLKHWEIWFASFLYHIAVIQTQVVMSPIASMALKRSVFITKSRVPATYFNLSNFWGFFIVDSIFLLMVSVLAQMWKKRYNPWGVLFISFMTNLFFVFYLRAVVSGI